jgi:TolB protein
MTATLDPRESNLRSSLSADPEMEQAVKAFHSGKWGQAIPLFEHLRSRYPDDVRLTHLIEDARFKAGLDVQNKRVHAKQVILPWRALLVRGGIVLAIVLLVSIGYVVMQMRILPMWAEMQREQTMTQLMTDAVKLLEAEQFDQSQALFERLLTMNPENVEAQAQLLAVAQGRELRNQYEEAVMLQEQGSYEQALSILSDLQIQRPGYRDVNTRVTEISLFQDLDRLFNRVQTLRALGLEEEAIDTLNQIRSLDADYKTAEVQNLLFMLNYKQGLRIVKRAGTGTSDIALALSFFDNALSHNPNDTHAESEARLAENYLSGRELYDLGHYVESVVYLRAIFDERPDYLNNTVTDILYDAYIFAGDSYQSSGDLLMAYESFREAANLPVVDTVAARGRLNAVVPLMTPTPTPTLTPTPGPTAAPATPTPTPTPIPLLALRGKIVFTSENPEQPGMWAMNPDGTGRQFLGPQDEYDEQYEALRETERFSPDKRYKVWTGDVDGRAQVVMDLPLELTNGEPTHRPLTRLTAIAYDPVWAPDGSNIAFVTQENGTDDIWVIQADGTGQKSLVRNDWEWEKHPSWSPDSRRLTFMSNREGTMAVWVMDAQGQGAVNISNVPWKEYNPIWVK